MNIPAAVNLLLDPTGAQTFRGQNGSLLYLPGASAHKTDRTVTAPAGTTLFSP